MIEKSISYVILVNEQSHLTEDTVSQSGWVFADLLVALSVVFLATVSFIPLGDTNNIVELDSSAVESDKLVRTSGFTKLYNSMSTKELLADLDEFRVTNGIPERVPIIHLQLIGSSESEDGRVGILDALEFSLEIQKANLKQFKNVSVSLDVSERLKPGQVLLRAVFGVNAG